MERLTMTSAKGGLAFTFDLDITCAPEEMQKIIKLGMKLKAYEDTGLEPDTCAEYKKFEDELVSSGKSFQHIIDLLEAEKNGRLVVRNPMPPIKARLFDNISEKMAEKANRICFRCPKCNRLVSEHTTLTESGFYFYNYCRNCGQEIDSEEAEAALGGEEHE